MGGGKQTDDFLHFLESPSMPFVKETMETF